MVGHKLFNKDAYIQCRSKKYLIKGPNRSIGKNKETMG
jgi:hypothetical protein